MIGNVIDIPPNWGEPVVEKLDWLTDVMQSFNLDEQRVRLRNHPRRRFAYTFALTGAEARKFRLKLNRWQGENMYLPDWTDPRKIIEPVSAGATVVSVDDAGGITGPLLAASQTVHPVWIVLWRDPDYHEAHSVASVNGLDVTLDTPLANGYTVNDKVYILFPGYLLEPVALDHWTTDVLTGRIVFSAAVEKDTFSVPTICQGGVGGNYCAGDFNSIGAITIANCIFDTNGWANARPITYQTHDNPPPVNVYHCDVPYHTYAVFISGTSFATAPVIDVNTLYAPSYVNYTYDHNAGGDPAFTPTPNWVNNNVSNNSSTHGTSQYVPGTYPVPPSGPNVLEVGTGQPYARIRDAYLAASDCDDIVVHPGTYDMTDWGSASTWDKNCRLFGATENPADVILTEAPVPVTEFPVMLRPGRALGFFHLTFQREPVQDWQASGLIGVFNSLL